jgi:antitoxin component YwqK of YwqJK toxin-antitoxin module
MEVVTTAHLALFRNSIILLILSIGFFGCDTKTPEDLMVDYSILLNKAEQKIKIENGLLIINQKPFSGRLFALFEASTDTAELSSYQNGKEHGEWKKVYTSGKIKERRFFEQGQKTGEYTAWWENGNRQLHYFFVADEYEGTCKEWNVEGKLVRILNYKSGHEEGHQQWWYDNGKVKANYVIKDGRRYGLLGTKNCINVSDSVFSK